MNNSKRDAETFGAISQNFQFNHEKPNQRKGNRDHQRDDGKPHQRLPDGVITSIPEGKPFEKIAGQKPVGNSKKNNRFAGMTTYHKKQDSSSDEGEAEEVKN